jgi:hypothetical protein
LSGLLLLSGPAAVRVRVTVTVTVRVRVRLGLGRGSAPARHAAAMRCTNTAAVGACDCRSLRFAADSIARMSSSAPSTGRSPGASTPPQAQQRAIEIAHRVDVPQAELLGDLGVARRLGLANPMVARRGASAVCASMAMPGVHVTVVSKPGLSTASHGFGPANEGQ